VERTYSTMASDISKLGDHFFQWVASYGNPEAIVTISNQLSLTGRLIPEQLNHDAIKTVKKNIHYFTTILLILLPSPSVTATTTSAAQVSSTPKALVGGVYRMGVNLGLQDFNGAANFMQNMFDNPGFEPTTDGHLIRVGTGATSSTFTDATDSGAATGYWVGAKLSVRTGAAAGTTMTVTGFTSGGSYTFGSCSPSCPMLATGVAVAEVLTSVNVGGNIDTVQVGGWGGVHDGHSLLSTARAYEGQGSVAVNVSDGHSHTFNFSWDITGTAGGVCSNDNVTPCTIANQTTDCGGSSTCLTAPQAGPWHPVVGSFETSFWALAVNTSIGTPQVSFTLQRTGGVNVSHTWTLTNDGAWHQYTDAFTGKDTGPNPNGLTYTFSSTNNSAEANATIYIDDAYLGKAASSATGFRNEVLTTLQAINPGSLRYANYQQLATNDGGYEGHPGCMPGNSSPTSTGNCDYLHGASAINGAGGDITWTFAGSDTYPLANQYGAVPFMTLGNVMSDADLKSFIDNLCSAISTYNFPSAWVEGSNENWNNGAGRVSFGSGNVGALGYGGAWGRNFSVMNTEAVGHCGSTVAAKIHYIMNNQACNGGVIQTALAAASAAGYPIPNTSQYGGDDAPYYPSTDTMPTASGSLSAQAAALAANFFSYIPQYVNNGNGCTGGGSNGDYSYVGSNNVIPFYEEGPNGYLGPGTTEMAYLAQAGYPSAAWMAQGWLQAQQQGRTPLQNEYQLAQIEYGHTTQAPIWGEVHDFDADFGPTFPHLRPIAMGEEVVNSVIGGAYYPIAGMASGTYASAFLRGTHWSAVLVNSTSGNAAGTITFPTGTVPPSCETVLYTHGITDNNENSNYVFVGSCASFSCMGQTCSYNLAPFSVEAMDPSAMPVLHSQLLRSAGGQAATSNEQRRTRAPNH
jgi:hypothetical protein